MKAAPCTATTATGPCDRTGVIQTARGLVCRAHDPNPPRPEGLVTLEAITQREVIEHHSQILRNELTAVLKRPTRDGEGRWRAPFVGYLDGKFAALGATEAEVLHAIAARATFEELGKRS